MGTLAGRRALVTAGGQGLGLAIATELARQGCDVVVTYRSSRASAEAFAADASRGRRALAVAADLTREPDARRAVDAAVDHLGGLDILVNNAGDLVARRTLRDLDVVFWQKVMDVNMTSMLLVTHQAQPHLEQAGQSSIVNLASLAGRKGGHPGSLAYSTAKGAVLTWTRALAAELAPKGVRVNAVAPGFILGTRFHATHTTRESAERTVAGIPLGRAGTPGDVARAVAFLASEYDGFITGATLDVNGGVHMI